MRTSAQNQPAPAPKPDLPQPTAVKIVGADGQTQTIALPKTQAEVDALLRRRSELSDQLNSVTDRRQQLVNQIRQAPDGVSRTGLEDRVKILDQRLIQLESDLASTGEQLAAAPSELVRFSTQRDSAAQGDDFVEGMAAGVFSLLFLFALMGGWRRFRRKRRPGAQKPAVITESDGRLERLERGMEAIAIEIERVSEGQRFVTRLLSESASPAGTPQRIAQPETAADSVTVR